MPDSLVALHLDADYRTDRARIGRDLVAQLLLGSHTYDRAAGFFSSSVFRILSRELVAFFKKGGVMRLVCSPRLEAGDLSMLTRAVFERAVVRALWTDVEEAFRSQKWSAVLGFLVATDQLKMRVAVPKEPLSSRRLYHEKIALFRDQEGNLVAISGSANESAAGLAENFERVDVFPSWTSDSDKKRGWRIQEHFRALWGNDTDGLDVMDLVDAFRKNVLEVTADEGEGTAPSSSPYSWAVSPEVLIPPADLQLRGHQKSAIAAWGDHDGRGMLEMATGSGKTLTALALAAKVSERLSEGFAVVIVAPLIHLVDQWREVASRFGLTPIRCAESSSLWADELDAAVTALNSGGRPLLSVITTADTLATPRFQSAIRRIRKPALLIADEVHNYGAPTRLAALPDNFPLRLGLSATPVRWHDELGSKGLESYFGPVVFSYSLKQAIDDGVLTPYRYYPELATLDDEELESYLELTALIARYAHGDEEGELGEGAKRLLIRRARILASARSKLPLLRRILASRRAESHILVYCGDGTVSGPVEDSTVRQVEEVVRMLGVEMRMRVAPYLAETRPDERRRLLKSFESGNVQALVAIRCLDEGVDVPIARTGVILASSTNPRQFVQRRGRLLRTAPGKVRAEVYDLFAIPNLSSLPRNSREWKMARGILGGQIRRAQEFADLAENGPVARGKLLGICEQMDLLSYWGGGDER